ncbi:MAG: hypothetical protein NVS3B17_15730 [Vulcanimicrobiaceae bacterium]
MRPSARVFALAAGSAPIWAGALAARTLAAHHPPALRVDFAQPLVVATEWGSYGAAAFGILAASVALATALTGATVVGPLGESARGDSPAVALAATLAVVGAGAWPFVFSSDCYAYAAYGHMALARLDPYAPAPASVRDAFVDAARWQWRGAFPVDVYGPAMLAIETAAVALAGGSLAGALLAMRVGAALAFLASIPIAAAALRAVPGAQRLPRLAAYALNPVVLWSVAEGHNDAVVLLVLSCAALAASRDRPIVAAALIGCTPLLKAYGVAFAVGFACDAVARRRRARAIVWTTAIALGLDAVVALPPLVRALHHVERVGTYAPRASLQGLVGPIPALALAVVVAGIGVGGIRRRDPQGYAWLGIAATCALPNAYPWYAIWLAPCAALGRGWTAAGLWLATIFAVARYLPDASHAPEPGFARLLAAVCVAPLALAVLDAVPRSSKKVSPS